MRVPVGGVNTRRWSVIGITIDKTLCFHGLPVPFLLSIIIAHVISSVDRNIVFLSVYTFLILLITVTLRVTHIYDKIIST